MSHKFLCGGGERPATFSFVSSSSRQRKAWPKERWFLSLAKIQESRFRRNRRRRLFGFYPFSRERI